MCTRGEGRGTGGEGYLHKRKESFYIDEQLKDDGGCSGFEGGGKVGA